MSDKTFDIAYEREICLQKHAELVNRLAVVKASLASLNRKKSALKHKGECIKQTNKNICILAEERDNIKARMSEVTERLRYFKQYRKNNRNVSDYFMEVCERNLDSVTYAYLKKEAEKMWEGGAE
jgi:hypothetical protein